MATPIEEFGQALGARAPEFGIALQADRLERLIDYYALIMKWNDRLHLVAPSRDEAIVIERVQPVDPPAKSVVARR